MIRLLPFILIAVVVLGGLGYWRYEASKPALESPEKQVDSSPIEVPKTLPAASLEDRVKSLENLVTKIVSSINTLKSSISQNSSSSSFDSLNAQVTELKARVSALENVTPAPAAAGTSSKSTVYIPLGSGGGPWGNQDWYSTPEYEISLDPANYPSYTGMSLEVTFKLAESAGTGSVRLYNVTDSSATSGQIDNQTSALSLKTTSSFKLASGTKTYRLQIKTTEGKDLFIQSARIRVNF